MDLHAGCVSALVVNITNLLQLVKTLGVVKLDLVDVCKKKPQKRWGKAGQQKTNEICLESLEYLKAGAYVACKTV